MIEILSLIDAETQQAVIKSWLDFGWEMISHPLISFLVGVFGGTHINSKVRGLYGKAAKGTVDATKALIPKKK